MNRRIPMLSTLIGAFALSATVGLAAEPLELRGAVFSLDDGAARLARRGVRVTLAETLATAWTDEQGHFRLPLPSCVKPGELVTLEVREEDGYVDTPWDGRVRIPPDPAGESVEIKIATGPATDLWNAERVEGFFAEYLVTTARIPTRRDQLIFGFALQVWRQKHGEPIEEDPSPKIERWIADARSGGDARRNGLADFLEAKFDVAARRLGEAAQASLARYGEAPSEESRRRAVRDLELQAAAQYRAEEYREASVTLRQALTHVQREETPLRWAELQSRLALVLHEQGVRSEGEDAGKLFLEAVRIGYEALEVRTREDLPNGWVETRENMAAALLDGGDLVGAALAYQEILREKPGHGPAVRELAELYHHRLDESEKAYHLLGGWLTRHPSDAIGRIVWTATIFATDRWEECLTVSKSLVEAIAEAPELAHHMLYLLTYQAASLVALDQPDEAVQVIDEALKRLREMDPVFSLDRSFTGTLRYAREASYLAHREVVTAIFEAAGAGERDWMVAGFEKVAEDLTKMAEDLLKMAEDP